MTLKNFTLTSNNNFVGYKRYSFFFKRVYLILITKNYLIGLVCNKKLHIESESNVLLNQNTLKGLQDYGNQLNPYSYLKSKLIKKIENKYLYDQSIFAINKANFRIDRNDVKAVNYNTNAADSGNYPNAGTIIIETKNGNKSDFILLGNQDGKTIVDSILTRNKDAFLN